MRITRNQLRQIIQEELKRSLTNEQFRTASIKHAQRRQELEDIIRRDSGYIEDQAFESDVPEHIRSQINRKLNPSNMYVLTDFLEREKIQYPLSQHESALVLGYLNEL